VLSQRDDRARSLAALTLSDVLLVNPVRDGLNLVAKEGPLLNTHDGVVVLSREAGAWEELELGGLGALGVNPFDVAGTADALHAALIMEPPARAVRAAALRAAVVGRTSADWWAAQLAAAQG
jgi:trehalose 6-phosphate synthase